jgi:hypothetical protein
MRDTAGYYHFDGPFWPSKVLSPPEWTSGAQSVIGPMSVQANPLGVGTNLSTNFCDLKIIDCSTEVPPTTNSGEPQTSRAPNSSFPLTTILDESNCGSYLNPVLLKERTFFEKSLNQAPAASGLSSSEIQNFLYKVLSSRSWDKVIFSYERPNGDKLTAEFHKGPPARHTIRDDSSVRFDRTVSIVNHSLGIVEKLGAFFSRLY